MELAPSCIHASRYRYDDQRTTTATGIQQYTDNSQAIEGRDQQMQADVMECAICDLRNVQPPQAHDPIGDPGELALAIATSQRNMGVMLRFLP